MKRFGEVMGIDLDRLVATKEPPFIHPTCPGARMYLTRADLESYVRGGEEFVDKETTVPREGYGHARVRCGRPVEVGRELGTAGHPVYFGLCMSCHRLEEENRSELRTRKNSREP